MITFDIMNKKGEVKNLTEAQKRFIESRMSRYKLSQVSGLSHKTIWAVFNNKNRATLDTYYKITSVLGLSLDEFFSMKD